jgi:hypothetical protein
VAREKPQGLPLCGLVLTLLSEILFAWFLYTLSWMSGVGDLGLWGLGGARFWCKIKDLGT